MNGIEEFVGVFTEELIDQTLSNSSVFKSHQNWSSLTSLIIITEIEGKFGVLIDIQTLQQSETIEDLFNSSILIGQTK